MVVIAASSHVRPPGARHEVEAGAGNGFCESPDNERSFRLAGCNGKTKTRQSQLNLGKMIMSTRVYGSRR
jgi:hypothetical protein